MALLEGIGMLNIPSSTSFGFLGITFLVLLGALLIGTAFTQGRQTSPDSAAGKPGKVLGLAFDSVQVSNLKRSIEYYQSLGFTLKSDANPPWTKDEAANRLYRTPGAMSRTATLTIPSAASGQPFTLYLYEYKDINRSGRTDFPARDPSAPHFGVLAPEADALWEKLKAAGTLRPLSWDGKLIRLPGQTSGGIAYVRDPDGFNIEIVGISQQPGSHPTLHHLGLAVLDSDKSKSFYGKLLGAQFPDKMPEWLSGDMYDAAVGGRGFVIRLINGAFPEAAAPQTTMPFELVEYKIPTRTEVADYRYSDVGVNCVGFQVEGIEDLHSRLKSAGIKVWSEGGIVQRKDGTCAVVIKDPDVGAFVELFEK
jgi:catechol 2,3-dioxygenase-like lactoylglutathione lyase family enzyme